MENYATPEAQINANTRPVKEYRWKRIHNEVNGKSQRHYKHEVSSLLRRSYAEIGVLPHVYNTWQTPCRTHYNQNSFGHVLDRLFSDDEPDQDVLTGVGFDYGSDSISFKLGVSALEFDTKGTNLASVTRSGCLTMHKFGSLGIHSNENDQLNHLPLFDGRFDSFIALRWNPSNQNEIAYTSVRRRRLTIFDIERSEVSQVLKKRTEREIVELSDIAFLNDGIRVLASDSSGVINMWDRRVGVFPQRLLTTKKITGLTSVQSLGDHFVYGAGRTGLLYVWDLRKMRDGRLSAAYRSDREVHSIPLRSINVGLTAWRDFRLHAININPSCSYQLAYHFDDGSSGVVDTRNYKVTHIHCPQYPLWLDAHSFGRHALPTRRPAWLPEHSIYAAPSTNRKGLHLLDFHPHPSSPCHLDYEDAERPGGNVDDNQSVFVPLSKNVTTCAVHPLNGTIVAGALDASLVIISQKRIGKNGDGDN